MWYSVFKNTIVILMTVLFLLFKIIEIPCVFTAVNDTCIGQSTIEMVWGFVLLSNNVIDFTMVLLDLSSF
jgi:hypothetical protein